MGRAAFLWKKSFKKTVNKFMNRIFEVQREPVLELLRHTLQIKNVAVTVDDHFRENS